MLILAIVTYSILVFFEFKPLYRHKHWSDFWVNAVLGFFSLTIAILMCLNVKLPSPAKPIQNLVTTIFGK